jgi:hypothetical protein
MIGAFGRNYVQAEVVIQSESTDFLKKLSRSLVQYHHRRFCGRRGSHHLPFHEKVLLFPATSCSKLRYVRFFTELLQTGKRKSQNILRLQWF